MTDHATITILRYRTPEGEPTCSVSIAKTCPLYRRQRFATVETCAWTGMDIYRGRETTFLQPTEGCPVWK